MKTKMTFQRPFRRDRRSGGFTLVELSIGLSTGLLVTGAAAALLHQQTNLAAAVERRDRLSREAPVIASVWTRLLRHTDTARLFTSVEAVRRSGTGKEPEGAREGEAAVVRRALENGETLDLLIGRAADAPAGGDALTVYRRRGGAGAPFEPLFSFGRGIARASFSLDGKTGALLLTLNGADGERFSLSMEQER